MSPGRQQQSIISTGLDCVKLILFLEFLFTAILHATAETTTEDTFKYILMM